MNVRENKLIAHPLTYGQWQVTVPSDMAQGGGQKMPGSGLQITPFFSD